MKIKNLITFILIFILGSKVQAQNKDIINVEKVYSFLNTTWANDTLQFNLSSETGFGIFELDTVVVYADSIFTTEDITFMKQQYALTEKLKWKKHKIIGAKVISYKKIKKIFRKNDGWNRFRKKYGNCLTSYSLPIFNTDYTYCAFYHWTQCDYMAGGGRLDLYKFEKGEWHFEKSYSIGMS